VFVTPGKNQTKPTDLHIPQKSVQSRDRLLGTVTRLGAGQSRVQIPAGMRGVLLFSQSSRSATKPTQPTNQWVLLGSFSGVKRLDVMLITHFQLAPRLGMSGARHLLPPPPTYPPGVDTDNFILFYFFRLII
jgi:hypothetical protein